MLKIPTVYLWSIPIFKKKLLKKLALARGWKYQAVK